MQSESTTPPIPEGELIERARQGDLEAFNCLVLAYQDRVYGLCLRMLGSPQAAEDAAQEAFLAAFRNVRRMRGETMQPWLLRIVSNACIDELRRRKRRAGVSLEAARGGEDERPFDVPDPAPLPEEELLEAEASAALQAALLHLPSDQRIAVVLCDIEGLGYDEIAVAMGCAVGTVKSRISRGRTRLRDVLRAKPELFGAFVRSTKGEEP